MKKNRKYAYCAPLVLFAWIMIFIGQVIGIDRPGEQPAMRHARLLHVLFVPDDEVKKNLLDLIKSERTSIYAAQFRISEKDVVLALCQASRRGVKIKIIVDCSCLQDRYEKVSLLCHNGIAVHKYQIPHSTMHNKFFVFFNNNGRGMVTWTGSANTTHYGILKNQENIIITNEASVGQRYIKKFDQLWQQTSTVRGAIACNCTDATTH